MKSHLLLFLSLSIATLFAVSCNRSDMYGSDSGSTTKLLTVKEAYIIYEPSNSDTKSDPASTTYNDTASITLCDTMRLTAQTGRISKRTTSEKFQTKGALIDDKTVITPFKINVYTTSQADFTPSATRTLNITASTDKGSYKCTPNFLWNSETDKVSLFSYFPLGDATNGLTEDANGLKVSYVVPTNIASQPDFCTTMGERNIVNEYGVDHIRSFGMHHRLTAINFVINGWSVKVTKIEITGVSFSGNYDLPTNTWATNEIGSDSRSLGLLASVPNDQYNPNPTWTNITATNGYLMAIPQKLTDAAEAIITYQGVNGNSDNGVIKAKLKLLTGGKWDMGMQVTYKIQLRTAPAVSSGSFYIPWRAGWTSNVMAWNSSDPTDKYTLDWPDSWCYIHQGNPKSGDISGGLRSGLSLSPTMLGAGNLYFFAKEDNYSTTSNRVTNVTLKGLRTATKSMQVVQGYMPIISVYPNTALSIPAKGNTYKVSLSSNYPWEVASTSSGVSVSNISSTSATIKVFENTDYVTKRNLSVVFRTTNDNRNSSLITSAAWNGTQVTEGNVIPRSQLISAGWPVDMLPPNGLMVEAETNVKLQWKTSATLSTGGSRFELGYGYANSYLDDKDNMPAINACRSKYPAGTWYLPSPAELIFIMVNQPYLSSAYKFYYNEYYWTSEQVSSLYACTAMVAEGVAGPYPNSNKQKQQRVRCVRNI